MVLAPKGKSSSALSSVAKLLGEFQLEVISVESFRIKDRSVGTILVKISPDHTEALDEDLNKLAASEEIDIATEFGAYSREEATTSSAKIIIASRHLKSSQFSSVITEISQLSIAISRLQSTESHSCVISIDATGDEIKALRTSLSLYSRSEGVAISVLERLSDRRLILLDMDSTVINEEVIDQLAIYAGVAEQVSKITASAMRGEIDFTSALSQRVSMLRGVANSALEQVRSVLTLTPGLVELIQGAHACGHVVAVVSGGFHNVIDPLLKDLGVDYILANTLQTTEAGLTGELTGPIVNAERKAEFLREISQKHEISLAATVAIGDGANDREMLKVAGTGIAFCAKPSLKEVADIVLDERDLSLVLPLLGM